MSGQKRMWVSEAEWRRLQQAASRLRDVEAALPGIIDEIQRQTQRDLERSYNDIVERQLRYEQGLAGVSAEVRAAERQANQRLAEQDHALRAAMTAGEQRLRGAIDATRERMDAQHRQLTDAIAAERAERARQVEATNRRIEEVIADVRGHRERAAAAAQGRLRDAQAIARGIRGTLPHERLMPNELDRLEAGLRDAEGQLAGGIGEAAVATAQSACRALSELRVEIELRDRRWRAVQAAADESLGIVAGIIEANRERHGIDLEGRELADTLVDVNEWTDGKLNALAQETADLLVRVRDTADPMSEDNMLAIVRQKAPALQSRLQDLVQEAGAAQLGSQLRANIAEAVADALAAAGWDAHGWTYVGNDYHQAVVATMDAGAADGPGHARVVVVIKPVEGRPGANVVDIQQMDAEVTSDDVLQRRAQAIADVLRDRGIEIDGAPVEIDRLPDRRVPITLEQAEQAGPEVTAATAAVSPAERTPAAAR